MIDDFLNDTKPDRKNSMDRNHATEELKETRRSINRQSTSLESSVSADDNFLLNSDRSGTNSS